MRKMLIGLLLLGAGCVCAATTPREGLTVSPVQTTLEPGQRATSVTMVNSTDDNKVIQAEVMRWTHVDGQDHYEPAGELLVNPPLFKLAAGASQIVRVGFAQPPAGREREVQYRLYLQEVPSQDQQAPFAGAQLKMLLRLGVPVFVAPAAIQAESIKWRAIRRGSDIELQLTNASNAHVRAAEVALGPHDGKPEDFVHANSFAYVFPGETHSWTLQPNWPSAQKQLTVQARTDRGETRVSIPLEAP
ncbi:MAG TPA: fimbria/pilus periplasmic chaperone [Nevskiaceae bacterium]|nr:fimbria/pilus periplasmic chaperone [Nevskiaceae bacterium]